VALVLAESAAVTNEDWAGVVMGVVGAALVLNAFGISRGLAEFFGPMKEEACWTMAGTPSTTWQWRMFGAVVLLLGVAVSVFADPV
jgi:hypothetical protein